MTVGDVAMTYGAANPSYSITSAAYMAGGNAITTLTPTGSGDTFVADGVTFTISPNGATTSGAGKTVAGSYQLGGSVTAGSTGNFSNTLVVTGALNIDKKALTASATGVTKTYDGTTSMAGVSIGLTGNETGDAVTISGAGSFSQANAGSSLGYTLSNLALAGADVGNYLLTGGSSFSGSDGVINKASATVTANSSTVTYNAQAQSVTGFSVSGLVNSETLSVLSGVSTSGGSGTNAATYAHTASGTDTNYNLSFTAGSLVINRAALTLTTSNVTKTYDGSTSAAGTATVSSGTLFGTDAISGGSFAFTTANAGAGNKTVTVSGVTLSDGNSGNNYTVTHAANTTSTINQAALSVTASNATKTYGDTQNFAGTEFTSSGLVNSETIGSVTLSSSGAAATANVASYAIAASAATGGTFTNSNYAITYNNGSLTVDPRVISLTGSRQYEGTTALASTVFTLGNLANSETLSLSGSGSMANKHVGTGKAVTLGTLALLDGTGGSAGLASNYTFTGGTHTVDISAAPITLTTSAVTKTYDGATSAAGSATVGSGTLFSGDTISGGSFAFADANAGTGNKTVSVSGISLDDGNSGNNYTITQAANTTSTISRRAIDLTGTRQYDGTTSLANGVFSLGNLVGTETLVLSGTGSVANKHVGTGKAVSVGSLALGNGANGGLANNYTFTGGTLTSDITAAPITLTTSNVTKTYDGTTTAFGTATVSSGTLFTGDTLSGGSFAFNTATAGAGNKTVTVSGVTLSDGNSGGNYTVSFAANTTSTINQAALSITANKDAKFVTQADGATYKGVSYNGFVSGEDSSALGGTLAISRSNSGVNTAGTYSGVLVASGFSSSNYSLSYTAGDYTIVAADQLLVTVGNVSNTYGTATTYGVTSAQYLASDNTTIVDLTSNLSAIGNAITLTDGSGGTATFTLAPQGAATSGAGFVKVGSYQLATSGTVTENSGNFSNAITVVGAHQVSAKDLTASASGVTKTYDGTNSMTGLTIGLTGKETNDVVTVSGSGSFSQANAASGLGYTLSNLTLAGADAGNYLLTSGSSFSGSDGVINKANATVSANSDTQTYNGLAQSVTGFTASGLVNGETIAVLSGVSTTGGSGTNAGSYTHTASGTDANYNLSFNAGSLVINKANATVSANSDTKAFNGLVQSVTGFTASGLVNGETLAVLSGVSTTGGSGINSGSYTHTASGTDANYNLSFNAGSLTIDPAPPVVVPPVVASPLAPGGTNPPAPSVSGSSGTQTGGFSGPIQNTSPETVITLSSGGAGEVSEVTGPGQVGAGGISISLNTDSQGNAGGGVQGDIVTVSVPKAMATAGSGFSFALPAQVREALGTGAITVSLADGSPVPDWMQFNPETRRFEAGAVPDGGLPLQVLIRSGNRQLLIVISERAE
ncbi:MAG: hypothetical protein H2172_08650 [Opitutus sp.]|nr:hypothetical protein [Opitutus sp.]